MKPMVTVFIPVYNAANHLADCIESIISQTYKNLDILIINDGSSDKSCDIINSFNDKRIRLLHNEGNKGLPFTRNKGLKEAMGKYFAILDADDIASPKRIEKQVEFLESNHHVDVVTTDYQVFTEKSRQDIKIRKTLNETKISLIFNCHICNSTAMIRIESLIKYGLSYNMNCIVAQDYEMWAQFSKYGNIANINEVLIEYRVSNENITQKSKSNKDKLKERKNIISNIQNDLLDFYGFELKESEKKLFNYFFGEANIKFDKNQNNYRELVELVKNLKKINKDKTIFEESLFEEVLEDKISRKVNRSYNTIYEKIKIYNILIKSNRLKGLKEIIKAHILSSLK